jgi:hypothetical protein
MVLTIGSTVIVGTDSMVKSNATTNFFTVILLSMLFNSMNCQHNIAFSIELSFLLLVLPKAKNPVTWFM